MRYTHTHTLLHTHACKIYHLPTHHTPSQVDGWISEMMKTACDESYRDPTNLQTKLQKHQAFEAELAANKGRVDGVCDVGQDLIDHTHYASHEIEGHIVSLQSQWRELDNK